MLIWHAWHYQSCNKSSVIKSRKYKDQENMHQITEACDSWKDKVQFLYCVVKYMNCKVILLKRLAKVILFQVFVPTDLAQSSLALISRLYIHINRCRHEQNAGFVDRLAKSHKTSLRWHHIRTTWGVYKRPNGNLC